MQTPHHGLRIRLCYRLVVAHQGTDVPILIFQMRVPEVVLMVQKYCKSVSFSTWLKKTLKITNSIVAEHLDQ